MRTFDNGTEIKFYVGEYPFVQISNDFDTLRITVRTDEADDECIMKYQSKLVNGWLPLEVDGHLKDSLVKECIVRSYRLTKRIRDRHAPDVVPEKNNGLTPDLPADRPADDAAEDRAAIRDEKSEKTDNADKTNGTEKTENIAEKADTMPEKSDNRNEDSSDIPEQEKPPVPMP